MTARRPDRPARRDGQYGGFGAAWQTRKIGVRRAGHQPVSRLRILSNMPRPRRLLVDAYNVLHVTGILAPAYAGPDLVELAGLIVASRWGGIRSSLVCDGASNALPPLPGRIEAIYAGAGVEADEAIETILEADSAPRFLRVISSDRRLQRAARRRRAGWMSSEEFLRRLDHDAHDRARRPRPAASFDDGRDVYPPVRPAGRDACPTKRPIAPRVSAVASRSGTSLPAATDGLKTNEPPHEDWRERLNSDDLDMRKWVPGVQPFRREDEPPSP